MNRIKFAKQVEQWLDVPYRHMGTTRNGCDCTGLLIGAARELGFLKNYSLRKYPADWNLHAMADDYICRSLDPIADKIETHQADVGDIILMYFGRCISHCGVLIDRKKTLMVHCYRTTGKVENAILRNSKWARHWVSTYRINEKKISKIP